MYHPIILNLIRPYLQKASESDLKEMILRLQNDIIPWVLNGDQNSSE